MIKDKASDAVKKRGRRAEGATEKARGGCDTSTLTLTLVTHTQALRLQESEERGRERDETHAQTYADSQRERRVRESEEASDRQRVADRERQTTWLCEMKSIVRTSE